MLLLLRLTPRLCIVPRLLVGHMTADHAPADGAYYCVAFANEVTTHASYCRSLETAGRVGLRRSRECEYGGAQEQCFQFHYRYPKSDVLLPMKW